MSISTEILGKYLFWIKYYSEILFSRNNMLKYTNMRTLYADIYNFMEKIYGNTL